MSIHQHSRLLGLKLKNGCLLINLLVNMMRNTYDSSFIFDYILVLVVSGK